MTFDEYRKKYFFDLSTGESRCKGIRAALDEALEKQDTACALKLYSEFIEENQIYVDGFEAAIIFPEYLALFEKNPELQDENHEDMMRSYKLILGGLFDFYEIPFSQIKNIYRQYSEFCDRYRYNKRSYYRQMWNSMYWHGIESFGECTDVTDCHRKMMKLPVDDLSEIPAGECDDLTKFILFVEKDIDKAFKTAEPIFSGKLRCPQVPLYTYINFAIYYFRCKDLKNTKKFLDRGYHIMHRDFGDSNTLTFDKGFCILMYAYIDTKKALQIFRKQLRICSANKCGFDNFYLYLSGVHTMRRLKQLGHTEVYIRLPDRDDDIYREDGIYSSGELECYFYQKAQYIANRFDERNGNNHFTSLLNKKMDFEYDKYNPSEELPEDGLLSYIEENMIDGRLPHDFALPAPVRNSEGVPFEDGEQDSISLLFEDPQLKRSTDLEHLIDEAVLSDDENYDLTRFEKLFIEDGLRALHLVDSIQIFITDNKDKFPPDLVYGLAGALAFYSNNREVIKTGLGIFEIFGSRDEDTVQDIIKLGTCNEFTVFAMWALKNEENHNELIFELAKKTFGWGRIHALQMLEPETDEIKKWILNEGIYNTIYNGYNAIACFKKSGAEELLRAEPSRDELYSIGVIMVYLIVEGPSVGIHAFENEKELVDLFIDNVQRFDLDEDFIKMLSVIGANYDNDKIKNRISDMGISIDIQDNETE